MVIGTDSGFMQIRNQAYRADGLVGRMMERLSTGCKLNRGADDPSGLAIAAGVKAQILGINTAIHNAQEALDFYNLRDAYLEIDQQMMLRVRDLAVRSANEATITDGQREQMQIEANGLLEQINKMAESSKSVGGVKLLYAPAKLDVIWVLDATASMGPAADALTNASAEMFEQFAEKGLDVRMLVTPFSDDISTGYGGGSVSWGYQQTAAGFQSDVSTIKNMIISGDAGGVENGLKAIDSAIDQTRQTGAFPFRNDPTVNRIMILVTDEDSDDGGETTDQGEPTANPALDATRTALINKLAADDIKLHVVAKCRYGGSDAPDDDYAVVVSDPSVNGVSIGLTDSDTEWVKTITATLANEGGDWEACFQIGPDNGQYIREIFSTVTVSTINAGGINVKTADLARKAISYADNAISFLADERLKTAAVVKRLESIVDDLVSQSFGNSRFKSGIEDADMAGVSTEYSKAVILSNMAAATQAHAGVDPARASILLSTVRDAVRVESFSEAFTA